MFNAAFKALLQLQADKLTFPFHVWLMMNHDNLACPDGIDSPLGNRIFGMPTKENPGGCVEWVH